VIVVVGDLSARVEAPDRIVPAGFSATVASTAAAAGSKVELVTRIGEDAKGDAVVMGLARAGIGHVATLRDAGRETPVAGTPDDVARPDPDDDRAVSDAPATPGPTLEAEDVGLALRYLGDYRVIVVVHPRSSEVTREAIAAAGWAAAHLVVITSIPIELDGGLPDAALAITADPDSDGLAERVGRYAAAVDAGVELDTAYAVLTGANAES
jgi:sugar/nucleoside kinase (ribokinase family)